MALEFMVVLKLKLFAAAAATGSHCHLHVVLLWFFLLKLPLAARMPGSFADMVLTVRLFFFRLNRVLLSDPPARRARRWERAVRLVQERLVDDGGRTNWQATEDSLHALSMIAM